MSHSPKAVRHLPNLPQAQHPPPPGQGTAIPFVLRWSGAESPKTPALEFSTERNCGLWRVIGRLDWFQPHSLQEIHAKYFRTTAFQRLTTNVYTKDIQSPLLRKINPTACSPNISNCVPVTPLALRHTVAPALHLFRAELMEVWRWDQLRKKTILTLILTEMFIFELKFSMTQIQESLDVTSIGKLSCVLISPYNLSDILRQVSLQLPAGLTMLTG